MLGKMSFGFTSNPEGRIVLCFVGPPSLLGPFYKPCFRATYGEKIFWPQNKQITTRSINIRAGSRLIGIPLRK